MSENLIAQAFEVIKKAMVNDNPSKGVQVEPIVRLPSTLTAQNGAKDLLTGKFKETVILKCDWCDGEGVFGESDCIECGGSGDYSLSVPIKWTTIKEIYKIIVNNYAT